MLQDNIRSQTPLVGVPFPECYTLRQSAGGSTLYMQQLMGGYLSEYGRLIDGPADDGKGLNNFTAAARVLSTGHRRGTSDVYVAVNSSSIKKKKTSTVFLIRCLNVFPLP